MHFRCDLNALSQPLPDSSASSGPRGRASDPPMSRPYAKLDEPAHRPEEHELTSCAHLSLACHHLGRGIVLLCQCGSARTAPRDAARSSPAARPPAEEGVIIPLSGSWKERWDILVLGLICYSSVVVPFRVCFAEEAEGLWWWFEVSMTFGFIIDMYFTFNTAYFDHGEWVTHRPSIARRYFQKWFWIDAPSSIPVELLDLVTDSHTLSLLRFLRMFRLLRLLKLLKIDDYIEALEHELDVSLKIVHILFLVLKMSFFAHVLGCFWFGVALASGADTSLLTTTWITSYDNGSGMESTYRRYLYSLYWALTTLTTVGYGDITPTNDNERAYLVGALLIGALVFGYMMSSMGSLIASLDRQAAVVDEKMDAVKEYTSFRHLPRDLSLRVKKHYKFHYTRTTAFDELDVLSGLPPSLRTEVTRFVLHETLGRLPLFSALLEPSFQMEVFPCMRPCTYRPGDLICSKGDASEHLIFLLEGEVACLSPYDGSIVSRFTPSEEMHYLGTSSPSGGNSEGARRGSATPLSPATAAARSASTVLAAAAPSAQPLRPILTVKHAGVFGEAVLSGRRRSATLVASKECEVLEIGKADLERLVTSSPRAGRRILRTVLTEHLRKERLRSLASKLLISFIPKGTPLHAALVIQRGWNRAGIAQRSLSSLDRRHPFAALVRPPFSDLFLNDSLAEYAPRRTPAADPAAATRAAVPPMPPPASGIRSLSLTKRRKSKADARAADDSAAAGSGASSSAAGGAGGEAGEAAARAVERYQQQMERLIEDFRRELSSAGGQAGPAAVGGGTPR